MVKEANTVMRNGCFDRAPFKETMTVQAGWYDMGWADGERVARWKQSQFRMERECQYQKDDRYNDPGCVGCKHKTTIQKELI